MKTIVVLAHVRVAYSLEDDTYVYIPENADCEDDCEYFSSDTEAYAYALDMEQE